MEPDPAERRKLMTVAVAGAGFTGVELVGELIEFLPTLCRKYDLSEDEVAIYNVEALGHILDMLPEEQRAKAARYMEKKGVEIRTNALIVKAEEGAFHFKDGTSLEAATLVWTCGVKGSSFLGCLDLKAGKAGRMEADRTMRSPGRDNVFLAGDGVWILENERPNPQIVEAAEQTAETAAHNIIDALEKSEGRGKKAREVEYKGRYHGFMVSIGSKYAVSHTGGISLSGFFAVALKHVVNLYYQVGVVGLNGVWAYLKHEILDIRNNRSLIGGFAAWKTPNYWLVPLRMYVGTMWLIQGIKKALGGWLDRANDFVSVPVAGRRCRERRFCCRRGKRGGISGRRSRRPWWSRCRKRGIRSRRGKCNTGCFCGRACRGRRGCGGRGWLGGRRSAVHGGADAVSAASEAVAESATQVASAAAHVADAADAVASATVEAAGHVSGGSALLDNPLGIYVWAAQHTVNLAPHFFQSGIVVFEILIGLALIGGAFTWLAAAASFVFSIMLIVGAMTDASIFWYMAAALAFLGGAGKSFGLDYWIMPFLKKLWNGTSIAKRTFLYIGEPTKIKHRK